MRAVEARMDHNGPSRDVIQPSVSLERSRIALAPRQGKLAKAGSHYAPPSGPLAHRVVSHLSIRGIASAPRRGKLAFANFTDPLPLRR